MIQTRHPSKHHHEWIHRRFLMYLSSAFNALSHTLSQFLVLKMLMSVWWFSNSSQLSEWSYVSNTSCVHFPTHKHIHILTHTYFTECHTSISHQLSKFYLLWSPRSFLFKHFIFSLNFIRLLVFHRENEYLNTCFLVVENFMNSWFVNMYKFWLNIYGRIETLKDWIFKVVWFLLSCVLCCMKFIIEW